MRSEFSTELLTSFARGEVALGTDLHDQPHKVS